MVSSSSSHSKLSSPGRVGSIPQASSSQKSRKIAISVRIVFRYGNGSRLTCTQKKRPHGWLYAGSYARTNTTSHQCGDQEVFCMPRSGHNLQEQDHDHPGAPSCIRGRWASVSLPSPRTTCKFQFQGVHVPPLGHFEQPVTQIPFHGGGLVCRP